jgi:hypothetical protein
MLRVEALLECVEGAGADVAVDDTECAEGEAGEALAGAGLVGTVSTTGAGATGSASVLQLAKNNRPAADSSSVRSIGII